MAEDNFHVLAIAQSPWDEMRKFIVGASPVIFRSGGPSEGGRKKKTCHIERKACTHHENNTFWVHQSLRGAESNFFSPPKPESGKEQILGRDMVVVVAAFVRRAFPESHWCVGNQYYQISCQFHVWIDFVDFTRDEVWNVHLLCQDDLVQIDQHNCVVSSDIFYNLSVICFIGNVALIFKNGSSPPPPPFTEIHMII